MTPGTAPLISARGLVKRFGDFVAVDGIDFDCEAGQIFGLLAGAFDRELLLTEVLGRVDPVDALLLDVVERRQQAVDGGEAGEHVIQQRVFLWPRLGQETIGRQCRVSRGVESASAIASACRAARVKSSHVVNARDSWACSPSGPCL